MSICSCSNKTITEIANYHHCINQAELRICEEEYKSAIDLYELAFKNIQKPFGKDLFNAAICSELMEEYQNRDRLLQRIINNTDEFEFVKSKFANNFISTEQWSKLINNREIEYNPRLRKEFKEILKRDQLFRPMYDTHDEIINKNRKLNVARILDLTDSIKFPSHFELGYTEHLRDQNHYIVLHHTAQRRSKDKSVIDLEPILYNAIKKGRFDPEYAIFYLNFQNDLEKGNFEVYSTWQHKHHLLPDSLNIKIWLADLSTQQIDQANKKRKKWMANSLEDIATKAKFLSKNNHPFIFTSVRQSISYFRDDFDKEQALEQYRLATRSKKEYKKKDSD